MSEYDDDGPSPFGRSFPAADWPQMHRGIPLRQVDEINTSLWTVTYGKYNIGGSWWNRMRLKAAVLRYRARDAWEVLRGRAEVD